MVIKKITWILKSVIFNFVFSLNLDSKYAKENATVLISTAINSVSGLAIDWVHDLLYWTDDVANTIEVAQVKNVSIA